MRCGAQVPQTISGYWLQRVIPSANLTVGDNLRMFGSFQYEKEMGNNAGPRPRIDEDQGDFTKPLLILAAGLTTRVQLQHGSVSRSWSTVREGSSTITKESTSSRAFTVAGSEPKPQSFVLTYSRLSRSSRTPERLTIDPHRSRPFGEISMNALLLPEGWDIACSVSS